MALLKKLAMFIIVFVGGFLMTQLAGWLTGFVIFPILGLTNIPMVFLHIVAGLTISYTLIFLMRSNACEIKNPYAIYAVITLISVAIHFIISANGYTISARELDTPLTGMIYASGIIAPPLSLVAGLILAVATTRTPPKTSTQLERQAVLDQYLAARKK